MQMIYAVIKRYEQGEIEFMDWYCKPNNQLEIYEKIMEITNGNHALAANISSWAELATEGEIYEFEEGEVEILDID